MCTKGVHRSIICARFPTRPDPLTMTLEAELSRYGINIFRVVKFIFSSVKSRKHDGAQGVCKVNNKMFYLKTKTKKTVFKQANKNIFPQFRPDPMSHNLQKSWPEPTHQYLWCAQQRRQSHISRRGTCPSTFESGGKEGHSPGATTNAHR